MDNNCDSSNVDTILVDLIKNQKKNISVKKKLLYNDLKRISKYINTSIFDDTVLDGTDDDTLKGNCSIWNGYITIIKNEEKNSYINFYFNGKKYALHRLLYINYIGELSDSEYIKFKCINKGKCCNIHHFYKINNETIIENDNISENKNSVCKENIIVNFNL
jgi:hypothetical protein